MPAATDLFSGDYVEAAYLGAAGFDIAYVAPVEDLLLGAAALL
jgi:hypothetical protein